MKRFWTGVNVQAFVLLLLSVTETVFLALFKPFELWVSILIGIASLVGVLSVRFAYKFAYLGNRWHSVFYRKNTSANADDEPSNFAIFWVKFAGYFLIVTQTVLMFI